MHKNVKGTRKIPEVCTSGIFRLKIAQKRKTPEKFKFSGVYGGFSYAVIATDMVYPPQLYHLDWDSWSLKIKISQESQPTYLGLRCCKLMPWR